MSAALRAMKALAGRSALLAGGLVGGFALAEGAARLVLPPPTRVVVRQVAQTGERLERERAQPFEVNEPHHPGSLFVDTPTGRRLRANARVTIENHVISGLRTEIVTNSIGYRNREIGQHHGTRILFLGDSITFADYLDEKDTFVRLVEDRGRARGHDWETVNAGVTAIGTENELAILMESGLAIHPDVVVLCYFLNDFETTPGVRIRPLHPLLARSYLLSRLNAAASQAVAWAGAEAEAEQDDPLHLGRLKEEFLASHPTGPGDPMQDRAAFNARLAKRFPTWGAAWSPQIWERMQVFLAEFKRLSIEKRFQLRFVIFPVKDQIDAEFLEDYPQRRFLEIARDLGVPALDVLPAFRRAHQASPAPLLYDFCHHTVEGSRLAADEIFRFLESDSEVAAASVSRRTGS